MKASSSSIAGKLQKDSAAARKQLKNAQDLTVVGAESLYFAILELEQTKGTLQRNCAASRLVIWAFRLWYMSV